MMNRFNKGILTATIFGALFAASISAAQDSLNLETADEITNPLLDPVNNDVKTNSLVALFIRLEISGNVVDPQDMQLTRIPLGQVNFSEDPSKIIFHAYNRNDVLVGRTSVADRRMVARDGETLILNDRTVSVIVPLLAKPEQVAITVPDTLAPQRFSVESAVRDFCTTFDADPICSDDPPESNPHFGLLRPAEP